MADASILNRLAPLAQRIALDNLSLAPEPFIGIAKVQIRGTKPDASLSVVLGTDAPMPGKSVAIGTVACAWLAPGEWLLVGDAALVDAVTARIEDLTGVLHLVTDLTHARASFTLSGARARDALAGHCPLDLSESKFEPGDVARSLLGETGMFLQRLRDHENAPNFRIIVDQTMSAYAVRMLVGADGKP